MIDKLKERMNTLADEAEKLYQRKIEIENESSQIDSRISQIVGALQELDVLLKQFETDKEDGKENT